MKIFVSYTLRDGILNTHLLREVELILARFSSPYIDVLHNRSLDPQAHVITMLNQASILLACLTPSFFNSNWVLFELTVARKRGIPIFVFDSVNKSWLYRNQVASLTTHLTGARVSSPFIERLNGFAVECAPG